MDVLYLIMLHIDRNVDKKFELSINYRSRENHVAPKTFQTDGHTDISNYRVASLLKTSKTFIRFSQHLLLYGSLPTLIDYLVSLRCTKVIVI